MGWLRRTATAGMGNGFGRSRDVAVASLYLFKKQRRNIMAQGRVSEVWMPKMPAEKGSFVAERANFFRRRLRRRTREKRHQTVACVVYLYEFPNTAAQSVFAAAEDSWYIWPNFQAIPGNNNTEATECCARRRYSQRYSKLRWTSTILPYAWRRVMLYNFQYMGYLTRKACHAKRTSIACLLSVESPFA